MAPVVLIPLYIYPLEGAWEPLFEAAQANPHVTFQVVVNPGNGPGPDALPDASYIAAIGRLCQLPNVQPLGYVHCTYGKRDRDAIERDIDTYMGWNDEGFRVEGIFFDETPWEPVHRDLMASHTRHVRETWRRTSPGRVATVVYNPGVVVVRPYFDDADYVVVFEQSARHWKDYFLAQGLPQIPRELRAKAVIIVHTCDESQLEQAVAGLTREIVNLGFGGIHLTDEVDGGYTRWPGQWRPFTDAL